MTVFSEVKKIVKSCVAQRICINFLIGNSLIELMMTFCDVYDSNHVFISFLVIM